MAVVPTLANAPRDILREVFTHGVIYGMTVNNKGERVELRATLSAVCHQWKTIVDATPLLWSLVYITLGRPPSRESWDLAMARSGTQPLDITVRSGGCPFEKELSAVTHVMQLLTPHIRRWKLIHLSLDDMVNVKAAVSLWKGTADALEEIFLSSEPECDSDIEVELALDPTFTAPKLQVFALYDIPIMKGGGRLPKHFPVLDELSLVRSTFTETTGNSWPRLAQVLKNLKHLRSLNFVPEHGGDDDDDEDEDEEDEDEDDENVPDVSSLPSLPALEELIVMDMSLSAINKLLGTFTAPRLSKLEIASYESGDDEEERLPKTKKLLNRFPSLRTLRLCDSVDAMELENVKYLAEDFERLEITHVDLEPLFQMLTKRTTRSKWPIPRLRSMEMHFGEKVPVAALRGLVEACATAGHAIESVAVHTASQCPQKDNSWFGRNVQKFSWTSVSDIHAGASSVTLVYGPRA
ncbi:uncharacterized protein B0H18DRAFT_352751 [Fomitopsis serialis]|uniref:uncharacterized protein n=1 Tax=Fomitopsis serialis TaxID=139415 RepID=UPI00200797BE|nr:uncharacterized protein B0H18DRAFT_352751 [Neoantrodia serialis]KAH9926178.1 hypothetical protein B0H18DRAFT_352751 [Neoantrodia serialis]